MRARDLYESDDLDDNLYIDSWRDYITKNCSEFLSYVKTSGHNLFRGISTMEAGSNRAFIGKSRDTRPTLHSNPKAQQVFDEYLEAMGIKALRRNSIFAISRMNQANMFGDTVYAVYPVNGASYAWSTESRDQILYWTGKGEEAVLMVNTETIKNLNDFKNLVGMTDTHIDDAMREGHSIWFTGKYVALQCKAYHELIDDIAHNLTFNK